MRHSKPPICRVHLFGYVFAPHFVPTLVTFLILPILINLGFWQLNRAQQKTNLMNQYAARLHATPISLQEIKSSWEQSRFQPVQLSGTYDNAHSFLLDNKIYQHHPGYQVLTPFRLDNHQTILINRGWIPLVDRNIIPEIKPIVGKQTITGFIDIPYKKPFLLKYFDENNAWPRRIQAIELNKISQNLKTKINPVIVLLSAKAEHGFVRDWQPVPNNMPPARHVAYAIQWFSLAITLIIIFVVVNTKKLFSTG